MGTKNHVSVPARYLRQKYLRIAGIEYDRVFIVTSGFVIKNHRRGYRDHRKYPKRLLVVSGRLGVRERSIDVFKRDLLIFFQQKLYRLDEILPACKVFDLVRRPLRYYVIAGNRLVFEPSYHVDSYIEIPPILVMMS